MKRALIFGIFLSLLSGYAMAEEPCPTSVKDEVKIDEPDEGCKPDLSHFAPVKFEFPSDKKDDSAADKKDDAAADKKADAAADKKSEPAAKPVVGSRRKAPVTCTYSAYAWDTKKGKSTDHFNVSKPYSEVTDDERDPNVPECTICREDQVEIDPHEFGVNISPIRICHVYADQVKSALSDIAKSGEFDFEKLEGYRPGKTRGALDKNGLRTQWSQHSYGTAIDINANRNAIYSNCPGKLTKHAAEVKTCKRGIGGAWTPEKLPRVSIVKDGYVYRVMTKFWKWGGEIDGTTKDVMHFSVTGY